MSTPSTPLVSGGGKKKRGGCCGGNAVDESAQRMEEGSEHTPLSIKGERTVYRSILDCVIRKYVTV